MEATTGPLGTGAATTVGIAIAAKWMAAHFNRPGFDLVDYDTYAVCGDGDLMGSCTRSGSPSRAGGCHPPRRAAAARSRRT